MSLFEKLNRKPKMPTAEQALPGREGAMQVADNHAVLGASLRPPFPAGMAQAVFGLGCFWGAERRFWQQAGVYSTAVGYCGGMTKNPSYQEVCSGMTGHNEVVLVVYDPEAISYEQLLKVFFESHDPTQGMQQGNDVGTQYRSGVYYFNEQQRDAAEAVAARYQLALTTAAKPSLTTEILAIDEFYYAEDYHQQYLAKNPGGYCGLGGTGVSCPL